MKHWTTIRTVEDLKLFQKEFSNLKIQERETIIAEMVILLDEYAAKIKIIDHVANKIVKEPVSPLRRQRRHRVPRYRTRDELDMPIRR